MNKENRKELQRASDLIEEAKQIVELIKDEEQEKFDNMPDGLQGSERGEKMQQGITYLDDVLSELENAIMNIENAVE